MMGSPLSAMMRFALLDIGAGEADDQGYLQPRRGLHNACAIQSQRLMPGKDIDQDRLDLLVRQHHLNAAPRAPARPRRPHPKSLPARLPRT